MTRIIQDEEERNRRINMVGDLCLNTGYSYRELSDYLTKHYFKISFVTVKNYLEKYIKMHPDKKEEINIICNQIVDLALLANKELNADELDLFIKRSNSLMSKVIDL